MTRRAIAAAACLALALVGVGHAPLLGAQPSGEWRAFQGRWSASGRRQTLTLENGEAAAIVDLSGAVVISSGDGLSRGFLGRVIGFDDGEGLSVGRAVWTDENGDQVFSRLRGETIKGGRRITGAVTGGTGRYARLEGEYAFTWQYVVSADEDRIQGRAADLAGRVRRGDAP